ncbi:Protein stn1-like protein [Cladobotryum mycophilum]|uniref:Protein stn1-like protein n=1 Tax=Cladobotryum mycophilum TaxID=491253 RepID=A0ABR0STA5_9HYPO
MTNAGPVALYPRYCFHLSPTVNTWCLLRATEIHGLDQHPGFEGEKFYFYKNLPIKWVRIVGVVVAIDEIAGRRFYFVDDSSGATIQALISITATKVDEAESQDVGKKKEAPVDSKTSQDPESYADIDIGTVVDIKGSLSTYREERQINIEKMVLIKTTAQELVLWEKRAKFRREVLDVPWALRDKDIRRCRKEAEKSEADAERKKKRLKAAIEGGKAQRQASRSESAEVRKENSRSKSREESVQKMAQDGATKGKYNALGL